MIKIIHTPIIYVKVNIPNQIKVTFKQIIIGGDLNKDFYTEEYIVVPKFSEQILYTQNKKLSNNITIKEIPVYEALNTAGGMTITIGEG